MTYLFQLLKLYRVRHGWAAHYHYVVFLLRHHMLYTVDASYKKKHPWECRYIMYSAYENFFQEDGSYIRSVITGVFNWHPLYYDTIGYNDQ